MVLQADKQAPILRTPGRPILEPRAESSSSLRRAGVPPLPGRGLYHPYLIFLAGDKLRHSTGRTNETVVTAPEGPFYWIEMQWGPRKRSRALNLHF